jgi:hypothetical protein
MRELDINSLYLLEWYDEDSDDTKGYKVIVEVTINNGDNLFNDVLILKGGGRMISGWDFSELPDNTVCQKLGRREDYPEYFL